MRQRNRLAAVIGAGALSVAVFGGCTPDDPPPADGSEPASPSASYAGPGGASAPGIPGASAPEETPSPSAPISIEPSADPTTVPTMGEAPSETISVAERYLDARENALAWNHDKPSSWLKEVKPIMTTDGYQKLSEGYSDEGNPGYAWSLSHREGLAVKVATDCAVPSAAGSTKTQVTLQCGVTDQVVDKSGKPIPLTKIPDAWTHVGPQPPAVLSLVAKDGEWLINADLTGQVN